MDMKRLVSTRVALACLGASLGGNAMAADLGKGISVGGLVEVEASSAKDYAGNKTSDVTLATVELAVDAAVNEWVTAHVLALHEDDGTEPWEIDEATVTLGNSKKNPFYLTAGRMFVPFGSFESHLVSDPLTLEVGETQEAALLVGVDVAGFSASVYAFNGDSIENSTVAAGDDTADHYGASLGYAMESGKFKLNIGADYINSIADSNGLTDGITDFKGDVELVSYVAGTAAHINMEFGPVALVLEQVSARDKFDVAELSWGTAGAKPSAYHAELALNTEVAGMALTVAISQQGTKQAVNLGLPETRQLFGASLELVKDTTLALEIATDQDYEISDGGTGEKARTTTLQLGFSF